MTKCAIPGSATVVRVSIETGEPTNSSLRGSVSAIPRAPTAATAFPIAPKDALNSLGGFDPHGQGSPRRGLEQLQAARQWSTWGYLRDESGSYPINWC